MRYRRSEERAFRGSAAMSDPAKPARYDVVIVGAGFSGLYMLHKTRALGLTARVIEAGDGVGGTWHWNRYPGARVDIESQEYSYSFSPELDEEWVWSERYASQPELLAYLNHVADRFDLRRDIDLETTVTAAVYDEAARRWTVTTDRGETLSARFCVMATGCLSIPKDIDIPGADTFAGPTYHTGRWPKEGVDFTGQRVAVIGTGSSAIQSIPMIAEQAARLTVFQRTPNFSLPAHNGPSPADRRDLFQSDRAAYREQARQSMTGVPYPQQTVVSWQLSDAERRERFERAWAAGDLVHILTQLWADQAVDVDGNTIVQDLVREKIREVVKDPEI